MGKHVKGKLPLSALIPKDLARATNEWLQRNPDYTRTDFAIKALSKKLRDYGVDLAGWGMDQILERRVQAPTKSHKSARIKKGKDRILVTAWMDHRILAELDKWRQKVRPPMTRTTFFIESIAELLSEEGLISDDLARRYGAYAEYRQATKELNKLLDDAEQLGCSRPVTDLSRPELIARCRQLLAQLDRALDALEHSPPALPTANPDTPQQPAGQPLEFDCTNGPHR